MQCCSKFCGEPADRCLAAIVGLNNLYAIMLDMSATALSKALNHAGAMPARGKGISVHAGLRMPCRTQFGRWKLSLAARPLSASGSPRAPVSNTILFAALSLCLAGCGGLQSGTAAKTTMLAPADTRTAHDLAPTTKPPEAPSKPAPPVPQNSQRISETKPPPATATRGAERLVAITTKGPEKLVAASAPVPVLASERTTLPAQPPDPKPPVTQDSGASASPPVTELVFKGPPHEAPQPRAGMKALLWLGLGLGGVALAVLARLCVVRLAKPPGVSAASKDDLKMPPELLFKEPLTALQEPVVAEKP